MASSEKKNTKVLIVEDDAFLAGIYTTKFSLEGFDVLSAGDGPAGIVLAQKESPDIILLDILMPKMDGFEVLDALKKNPKTNSIPVVMLTNLGQEEDIRRGLKGGAVDYIIKVHFGPAETIAKVRKILAHVS